MDECFPETISLDGGLPELIKRLKAADPLLSFLQLGILVIDGQRNLCHINRVAKEMGCCLAPVHIPPDSGDSTSGPIAEPILHQCDCEVCAFLESFDPKTPRQRKIRKFTLLDGTSKFFEFMPVRQFDADGHLLFVMQIIQEISEAESLIRPRSELGVMLSNILDNTADAVITTDSNGQIHSWNRGAEALFGYERSEVRGMQFDHLLVHDVQTVESQTRVREFLKESGFAYSHETRLRTKSGDVLFCSVTHTAMTDSSGSVFGHSIIIRNISQVVTLQHDLKETITQLNKLLQIDSIIRSAETLNEIYQAVLTAVTAGEGLRFNRAFLLMVDNDRRLLKGITAVGPGSPEEAAGIYSRLMAEGKSLHEILADGNQQATYNQQVTAMARQIRIPLNHASHPLVHALATQTPSRYIHRSNHHPDLEQIAEILHSTNFVAVPMVWQGQPIGVIIADNMITQRDISSNEVLFLANFANRASSAILNIKLQTDLSQRVEELKAAYQNLTNSQRLLIEKERMAALGEVSSTVAHEIRNPIASIGGFAKLLLKRLKAPEHIKYTRIIADEATRADGILRNVLDKARKPKDEMEPYNINDLVEDTLTTLQNQLHNDKITIERDLQPDLPPLQLNEDRMKQVLINIVKNAIESMSPNSVLRVFSRSEREEIVLVIQDTGVGMTEEAKRNLFTPFYTTKSSGVGLGLATSKKIIEEHRGHIEVYSQVGEGTTFEIWLPKYRVLQEEDHERIEKEIINSR